MWAEGLVDRGGAFKYDVESRIYCQHSFGRDGLVVFAFSSLLKKIYLFLIGG